MIKIIYIITAILFLSCSSFINDESIPLVKKYEENTYKLKTSISNNKRTIPSETKVKIKINFSDDWIKVYVYREDEDILKSERILLVYLFSDEFKEEEFDIKQFEKKLFTKAEIIKQ